MSAHEVAKVIYAPHKAFKEVIQNPRYVGPLIIMVLFVIANVGWGYSLLLKRHVDQTVPDPSELDKWTENSAFWNSNAPIIANNTDDHVNGSYCGNKSIEFKANSTQIWIKLNLTNPLNCSGNQGYKNLTFSVKMIVGTETQPSDVTLYLFSSNSDYFYYNLTDRLGTINVWNNITVTVGPESQGWKNSTAKADWSNISVLGLNFTFNLPSNITLLVDGLFFHGLYKSLIETNSLYLVTFPINAFMQFVIQWVLLGGMLYIVPKIFKLKTAWKPLLIIAGFILTTLVIQTITFAAVSLAWPDFYISLKSIGGVPGGLEESYMQTLSQYFIILWSIDKVIWVWIIALCAIAFKLMFEVSWLKSVLIAVPSYLLYILVLLLLIPGVVLL